MSIHFLQMVSQRMWYKLEYLTIPHRRMLIIITSIINLNWKTTIILSKNTKSEFEWHWRYTKKGTFWNLKGTRINPRKNIHTRNLIKRQNFCLIFCNAIFKNKSSRIKVGHFNLH